MKSFVDCDRTFGGQPPRLGVLLSQIDVGRGREELYRDQVPELLRSLANQTKIASVSASSAIEGVTVDPDRAERIIEAGVTARFRDRNEREFAGYRDAIDAITNAQAQEPMSVPLILRVHRDLFRHTDARGGYLKTDDNMIVSYEDGDRAVLFEPPRWQRTEWFLTELVDRYNEAVAEEFAHPIVLCAAFVLDLLGMPTTTRSTSRSETGTRASTRSGPGRSTSPACSPGATTTSRQVSPPHAAWAGCRSRSVSVSGRSIMRLPCSASATSAVPCPVSATRRSGSCCGACVTRGGSGPPKMAPTRAGTGCSWWPPSGGGPGSASPGGRLQAVARVRVAARISALRPSARTQAETGWWPCPTRRLQTAPAALCPAATIAACAAASWRSLVYRVAAAEMAVPKALNALVDASSAVSAETSKATVSDPSALTAIVGAMKRSSA